MQIATLYATVGADTRDFQRNMQTVDGRLRDVKGRFTALERNKITVDTDQAESKLRGLSNLSGVVTTALGTLGGNLLTATISKVTGGVSDIISRGLEMNDVLERAQIGFTTMLGSADKANAKIAELQKFAETTPFEFKGLVQNSQLLLGFGFRAEELIPTLTAVGNALSAMGRTDNLDRVLLQLGQMRSKGKVAAQEINLIAENGIPVWQILSEKVGVSVKELQKMGEQGQLNAEIFQKLLFEGLQQRYAGALDLASQTRTGRLSNLQDILDKRAAQGTSGLDAELKTTITNATKFLEGPGGDALAGSLNTASEVAAIAFNQGIGGILNNGQLIADMTKAGGQVVNGFSDGVVAGTQKALESGKNLASGFITTVNDVLGIRSPSRVMIVVGQEVAEGFIVGLESKKSEILATMSQVFGPKGAESLFKKGILFGPGFFTSGNQGFDQAIAQYSKSRGLDPVATFAQLLQESRFNPNATSPAGAKGLAQFIPGTAQRFGLNPSDPIDSIRANTDYMRQLLDKFSQFPNALSLALAGYNAGENRPGTLGKGVIPNIAETQNYVRTITEIRDLIRSGQQAGLGTSEKILTDLRRVIAEAAVKEFERALPSSQFRLGARDPFAGTGSVAGIPNLLPLAEALPDLKDLVNLTLPTQTIADNLKEIHIGFAPVLEDYSQLNKIAEQTTKTATTSAQEQKKNLQLLTGAQNSAMATFAKSAQGIFQDAFSTLFEEGFGGFARKLLQGFTELIFQLVAKALAAKLVEKLFGGAGGGAAGGGGGGFDFSGLFSGLFKSLSGVFKGVFSFFGALFGGKSFGGLFADGGPVSSNKSYIVGERGPEIFVPNTSGMIVPNNLAFGGAGGPVVNQTLNFYVKSDNGYIARESQGQIAARSGQAARRALERNE